MHVMMLHAWYTQGMFHALGKHGPCKLMSWYHANTYTRVKMKAYVSSTVHVVYPLTFITDGLQPHSPASSDTPVYIHTNTYTHKHTYTYSYIHTGACTHMHTSTNTHTLIYIHTYVPLSVQDSLNFCGDCGELM